MPARRYVRKIVRKVRRVRRYKPKMLRPRYRRNVWGSAGASFKARSNKAVTRSIQYTQSRAFPINLGEFGAMNFQLKNLLSTDELNAFATLYDLYQIKGVKVRFVPKTNMNSLNDGQGAVPLIIPEVITAIDLDDDTAPASVAEMLEYGTVRRQRFTKEMKRYIKPRALNMVYNGATSTAYSLAKRSEWLDLANNEVPHYGFKWVITPGTTDPTLTTSLYYDVYIQAYIAFKNRV